MGWESRVNLAGSWKGEEASGSWILSYNFGNESSSENIYLTLDLCKYIRGDCPEGWHYYISRLLTCILIMCARILL